MRHEEFTVLFLPTLWVTMSSCTPTTLAMTCWNAFTSFVSKPIVKAANRAAPRRTSLHPRRPAPADFIGGFAVTSGIGLKEVCDRFRTEHDDYNAIMAEAIADRLAEAFAECFIGGFGKNGATVAAKDRATTILSRRNIEGSGRLQDIPPARTIPKKGPLWRLLDVQASTGMLITESFAMAWIECAADCTSLTPNRAISALERLTATKLPTIRNAKE